MVKVIPTAVTFEPSVTVPADPLKTAAVVLGQTTSVEPVPGYQSGVVPLSQTPVPPLELPPETEPLGSQ